MNKIATIISDKDNLALLLTRQKRAQKYSMKAVTQVITKKREMEDFF